MEADRALLAVCRDPCSRTARVPAKSDRHASEAPGASGPGVGTRDLGVGRLSPRNGRRQPVRRDTLFHGGVGLLQGLGRDGAVLSAGRRNRCLGRATSARAAVMDIAATLRARLAVLSPLALEIHDASAAHVGDAGAATGAGHFAQVILPYPFTGVPRL